MSAVNRVGVVAMALLVYALAACSPQAYQVNPNPDVAKKGEQVPESEQEGYMRIIGDLRWDELPNKEAWQKRFNTCFKSEAGVIHERLVSKYVRDGKLISTLQIPELCSVDVGGFRITPEAIEFTDSIGFAVDAAFFTLLDDSQRPIFKDAIKAKYSVERLNGNSYVGPNATWYCGKYTCWYLDFVSGPAAIPSSLVNDRLGKLNTKGVDSSKL